MARTKDAEERDRRLLLAMLAKVADSGPRRIVGLDLSMARPGFAVVYGGDMVGPDGERLHAEHMETKADPTVWGLGHGGRLDRIVRHAVALVRGSAAPADLVIIEAAFGGTRGNNDGLELAGAFAAYMHAYGLDHIPVVPVVGSQLKVYAAGSGKAGEVDKAVMALAARDRLGWQGTVHDEADALWLAAFGWALLGMPIVELPKTHTRAIDARLGRPVSKAKAAA